jgi:hypothetical protein
MATRVQLIHSLTATVLYKAYLVHHKGKQGLPLLGNSARRNAEGMVKTGFEIGGKQRLSVKKEREV